MNNIRIKLESVLSIWILVFLICSKEILASSEDSILILTPHTWLGNYNQTILVDRLDTSFLNQNNAFNIRLVKSDDSSFDFSFDQSVLSSYQLINFKIPNGFPAGSYNLTVSAKGDNNYKFENFTQDIEYVTNKNGYYIVTDKSVYQASEKVNIRVIGINGELIPINNNKSVSVYILDPNSNRVKQYLDLKFSNGLIDDLSFKLSKLAILGTWQIKLVIDDYEQVKEFNVEEYILPRFDFEINAPNYYVKPSGIYEGSLEAKYTYGKFVEGDVLISISNRNNFYYFSGIRPVNEVASFSVNRNFKLTNGKLKFSFPLKLDSIYYSLVLNVTVTDSLSGETRSKEILITVYDVEFSAFLDRYDFDEGKTNKYRISLKDLNGKPYPNKNFKAKLNKYQGFLDSGKIEELQVKSDMNGIISLEIFAPKNTSSISLEISLLNDNNQSVFLYLYKRYELTDMSSDILKIEPFYNNTLAINSDIQLNVKVNSILTSQFKGTCFNAKYLIISKSIIKNIGTFLLCDETIVKIRLTSFNAPYSNLVVYFLDPAKNIYVQNYEIQIQNFYSNYLNLAFDKTSAQPNELVNLNIQTEPNSLIGICVYDQSLDLLQPANDLKNENILSYLDTLKLSPYYQQTNYKRPSNYYFYYEKKEAETKFQNYGLIVLNDLNSLKPTLNEFSNFFQFENGIGILENQQDSEKRPSTESPFDNANDDQVDQVRSDFRDSWIWRTVNIKDQNYTSIQSIIPDTITSWVATGFSLNSKLGIAVANKTNITGFKSFFVTLISPKTLIRGEILILQAIVYNYLDYDLKNVKVSLSKTKDFKNVIIKNGGSRNILNDIDQPLVKVIPLVKSQTGRTVSFIISPSNIGSLKIIIKAKSDMAGDAEIRYITVKPEGIKEYNNIPLLIDLRKNNSFENTFEINLPSNIVKGSDYCSIQVIGDILGSAFNNINNLIRVPYGCGEQNMITLTPNIYVLRYLLASSSADKVASLKERIKSPIQFGYQNQLNYLREEGSFSAFGKSDKNGSSWLTAFVVKSFSQAREYADIDESVIIKSVLWLIEQQNIDGSFNEPGNVIHYDMQGGVNSKTTITAYIVISLLESNLNQYPEVKTSISNGLKYLENVLNANLKDTYALSLITYALSLGKSRLAEKSFNELNKLAIKKISGQIYWSNDGSSSTINTLLPIYRNQASSSEIEITSYGLLSSLLRNDLNNALLIVRWLVSKSNSLGSYSSTQNTILALQSLSEFGVKLMLNSSSNKSPLNVHIDVELTNSKVKTLKSFDINPETVLLLQVMDIVNCNKTQIKINAKGNGIVSFKTTVDYNLPKPSDTSFIIITQSIVTKDFLNKNVIPIKTCASYDASLSKTNQPKGTGMVIVESSLFGGFETNKQEILNKNENVKSLKLIEVDQIQNKISFYFDNLNNKNTCIYWKQTRSFPVSNIKSVPVTVYDYYKPSIQKTILFSPPEDYASSNVCKTNSDLTPCKQK